MLAVHDVPPIRFSAIIPLCRHIPVFDYLSLIRPLGHGLDIVLLGDGPRMGLSPEVPLGCDLCPADSSAKSF